MMTNDELKKKIVEIIINAIWKDAEADYDSTDETEAGSIADALIAAGIGDINTVRDMGVKATTGAILVAAKAEHRAKVAERALKIAVSKVFDYTDEEAIAQAKKELAEEQGNGEKKI